MCVVHVHVAFGILRITLCYKYVIFGAKGLEVAVRGMVISDM